MAVTCGFFNALNHDRLYDAIQMSSIFDGIIKDGIFMSIGNCMEVTAPENGMVVNVGSGRAWFNHTWILNDTIYPIESEPSEVVLDRIDAVVIEVNSSAEVRNCIIKFVKGTPSSYPEKPTMIHNPEVNQYALAYVTIRAGQSTIFQTDIENNVGTSETPYITGILETVDATQLLRQWQAQFDTMMSTDQTAFVNWFANKKVEYEDIMEDDQAAFEEWFIHLQNELDENQAAHLQHQIDMFIPITNAEIDSLLSR